MNEITEFWNQRYTEKGYAYGEEPNDFLAKTLASMTSGKILFPAEGEGRNAVHAAQMGWEVSAFDISHAGKEKATLLAKEKGVSIDYQVGELDSLHYPKNHFDAIALIYAHFPGSQRSLIHQALWKLLKPGGTIILEGFSQRHLTYQEKDSKVGGPKDLSMLFNIDSLRNDFSNCHFLQLEELEISLSEGKYHRGIGSVIRLVGRKW
jgi:SAM-dependent methyltransferase